MMLNRVSLNTIGLNRIGLNRIGKPSRASSDRPYIDPEVLASLKAVCICYGKSNDDPDRAVVKNLVDPDNPFVISNAAFKLNSGFGEYAADFLDWTSSKDAQKTSFEVKMTSSNYKENWVAYKAPNTTFKAMKVRISGIPDGGYLQFFRTTADGGGIKMVNGINEIPAFTNTVAAGFYIDIPLGFDWSNLVIEQIPSFEGAFVTDGVNDLITSTKSATEMLDGSNEITVVSMIHQIGLGCRTNFICDKGSYWRCNEVANIGEGKTGIYGYSSTNISVNTPDIINNVLGDKVDYSVTGDRNDLTPSQFSVVGYISSSGEISYTSSVAWYWTIIANKVLTTDQINQVIAYFNLDRTLKPDILCDVKKQGITNENHAEFGDKLIDFSGNGRDIQLNNIAWNKESGINDDGALCLDGVNDFGKVTGMPIYKDYTVIADYIRTSAKENAQDSPILSKSQVVNNGAFVFNYLNINSALNSYSFGINNELESISDSERKIYYQSKYVNDGKSINSGTGTDYNSMWLGAYRDNVQIFFNGAIYSLMSFPYSMSEFLIERQLKKYKLGTLYPDMVEFRPIVKSNLPYSSISYSVNPGEYISVDSMVTITVTLPNTSDKLMEVSCNAISDISISGDNGVYEITGKIVKSPQKINLVISSYLTMLSNSTLISNETLIKNEWYYGKDI